MTYKAIIPNGKDVRIGADELEGVLRQVGSGGKSWIVVKHGVFNPAFVAQIAPAYDIEQELAEMRRQGIQEGPSPFAKLLTEKMAMLSPQSRTVAQEEAAREERRK